MIYSRRLTLRELAERLGCRLDGDGSIEVGRAATLEAAGPGDLSTIEGQRAAVYRVTITNTQKGESTRYRVSEADWNTLNAGDSIYFTVKRSGGEPCISDEKGNPLVQLTRDNGK